MDSVNHVLRFLSCDGAYKAPTRANLLVEKGLRKEQKIEGKITLLFLDIFGSPVTKAPEPCQMKVLCSKLAESFPTSEHVQDTVEHREKINTVGKFLFQRTFPDHDMSKFSDAERIGYQLLFFEGVDGVLWDFALWHHYHSNSHHPEHYLKTSWQAFFRHDQQAFKPTLEQFEGLDFEEVVCDAVACTMRHFPKDTYFERLKGIRESYAAGFKNWPRALTDELIKVCDRVLPKETEFTKPKVETWNVDGITFTTFQKYWNFLKNAKKAEKCPSCDVPASLPHKGECEIHRRTLCNYCPMANHNHRALINHIQSAHHGRPVECRVVYGTQHESGVQKLPTAVPAEAPAAPGLQPLMQDTNGNVFRTTLASQGTVPSVANIFPGFVGTLEQQMYEMEEIGYINVPSTTPRGTIVAKYGYAELASMNRATKTMAQYHRYMKGHMKLAIRIFGAANKVGELMLAWVPDILQDYTIRDLQVYGNMTTVTINTQAGGAITFGNAAENFEPRKIIGDSDTTTLRPGVVVLVSEPPENSLGETGTAVNFQVLACLAEDAGFTYVIPSSLYDSNGQPVMDSKTTATQSSFLLSEILGEVPINLLIDGEYSIGPPTSATSRGGDWQHAAYVRLANQPDNYGGQSEWANAELPAGFASDKSSNRTGYYLVGNHVQSDTGPNLWMSTTNGNSFATTLPTGDDYQAALATTDTMDVSTALWRFRDQKGFLQYAWNDSRGNTSNLASDFNQVQISLAISAVNGITGERNVKGLKRFTILPSYLPTPAIASNVQTKVPVHGITDFENRVVSAIKSRVSPKVNLLFNISVGGFPVAQCLYEWRTDELWMNAPGLYYGYLLTNSDEVQFTNFLVTTDSSLPRAINNTAFVNLGNISGGSLVYKSSDHRAREEGNVHEMAALSTTALIGIVGAGVATDVGGMIGGGITSKKNREFLGEQAELNRQFTSGQNALDRHLQLYSGAASRKLLSEVNRSQNLTKLANTKLQTNKATETAAVDNINIASSANYNLAYKGGSSDGATNTPSTKTARYNPVADDPVGTYSTDPTTWTARQGADRGYLDEENRGIGMTAGGNSYVNEAVRYRDPTKPSPRPKTADMGTNSIEASKYTFAAEPQGPKPELTEQGTQFEPLPKAEPAEYAAPEAKDSWGTPNVQGSGSNYTVIDDNPSKETFV